MMPSFSSITESLTYIKVHKIVYDTVVDEIFLFLNSNLIKHKKESNLTEAKNVSAKNIVKTNSHNDYD